MSSSILIVDDAAASRQTIEGMLFREGHRLRFAESGWDCLEQVEAEKPDLILLDVMMPGLSGYDVCRRLKGEKTYQFIPIILLTALNEKKHLLEGLEAGADEFVSKPVSGPELRARVKNLLRMKSLHDELESTMQFRDDLVRFLVHDMRSPLVSIRLQCELGLLDFHYPEVQDSLRKILTETRTLNGYVDEMLSAASLEGNRFPLTLGEVWVDKLVEEWLRCHHLERLWELSLEGERGPWLGDPGLLTRLLDNLLSNALKYGDGKPVQVSLSRSAAGLVLRVADQGFGIPPEHRARIFEKHGMVPLRKAGVQQTGLGLYFCKLVVAAHGGTIEVEENRPGGSVFVVRLPQLEGDPMSAGVS